MHVNQKLQKVTELERACLFNRSFKTLGWFNFLTLLSCTGKLPWWMLCGLAEGGYVNQIAQKKAIMSIYFQLYKNTLENYGRP